MGVGQTPRPRQQSTAGVGWRVNLWAQLGCAMSQRQALAMIKRALPMQGVRMLCEDDIARMDLRPH